MIILEKDYEETMKNKVMPLIRLNMEDGFIKSTDGTRIHYNALCAPDAKAAIVISHGLCECIPKYYEFMYLLYNEGYSVYISEHRGHGYSDRSVSDMGMVTVNSFDDYIEDFYQVINQVVRKKELQKPLYLFAHSMGGAIGAYFLEKHPDVFSKAVLSSPMIEMLYKDFSDTAVKSLLLAARILGWKDKYMPGEHTYDGRYDFENSCGQSQARYDFMYKMSQEDEHYRCSGAAYRWCFAARKTSDYIKAHANEIKIPVLLCQAGKDTLVSNAAQDYFIQRVTNGKKIFFPESKHEVFNGTDEIRRKQMDEMLAFWA